MGAPNLLEQVVNGVMPLHKSLFLRFMVQRDKVVIEKSLNIIFVELTKDELD